MKETGKLVRGVVYEDVNLNEMKEEMFEFLERMDNMSRDGVLYDSIIPHAKYLEESPEEVIFEFKNMDAIAALTRMDPKTFETHNMIIPKESLSKNMVKELSSVDLGKNLVDDYILYYLENHNDVLDKEPKESSYTVENNDIEVHDLDTGEYLFSVSKDSKLGQELLNVVNSMTKAS